MVVIAQNVGAVVCWLVFCITTVDVKNFTGSPCWLHGHPNSGVAHADDRLNWSPSNPRLSIVMHMIIS